MNFPRENSTTGMPRGSCKIHGKCPTKRRRSRRRGFRRANSGNPIGEEKNASYASRREWGTAMNFATTSLACAVERGLSNLNLEYIWKDLG